MAAASAEPDLARLVVRHRHVAPMLSALLTGTNAGCRISDADGTVIIEREGPGIGFERFPITVEGRTVGWVEGDRAGRAIAAVLSYAVAREADKRSLAREALDRYRELSLVYELADELSEELDLDAIGRIAVAEASKLPAGGTGFLVVGDGSLRATGLGPGGEPATLDAVEVGAGIVGSIAASAIAEEVNDVAGDPRASEAERRFASLIGAPVVARGRTLGVLGAASRTPVEYQAADLKLLAAIAAIAGPALAQARASAARGLSVG
ncbi:MAG TPA: GAF domain-containing protein [Candidatus Limnocylindrales bacterium]|nr:GAF domain-containing protein [Candidatus Limnocylindrales bacterium]